MGRCIGHGTLPVFTGADPYAVLPQIHGPPTLIQGTQLSIDGAIHAHGFAVISLDADGGPAQVEYYQNTAADMPMYRETIGQRVIGITAFPELIR
jgi:hypothetical protein